MHEVKKQSSESVGPEPRYKTTWSSPSRGLDHVFPLFRGLGPAGQPAHHEVLHALRLGRRLCEQDGLMEYFTFLLTEGVIRAAKIKQAEISRSKKDIIGGKSC